MGQGAAQALVKEGEEDGDLHDPVRETTDIMLTFAFQQGVAEQLGQVVAALARNVSGSSQDKGAQTA